MSEKELSVRVYVSVVERWGVEYRDAIKQEITLIIPAASLPGVVGAIDTLVHGATVQVVADYLHKQAEKAEEKLSEEESND